MQINLNSLHQQFQQKHLQLSKVTNIIDSFMQTYKLKINTIQRESIKDQIKNLQTQIQEAKSQFNVIRKDLITYGQLPSDFVKMMIELPKIYEDFWQSREQELMKNIQIKQEQNKIMREKLAVVQEQNNELKLKLQYIKIKNKCQNIFHEKLSQARKLSPTLLKGEQFFDQSIQHMEITIRESDDQLFKRITEQGSQEEDSHYELTHHMREEINTARQSILNNMSLETNNIEPSKNKFKTNNIHKNTNKNQFWNKFTKHLNTKSKDNKSKSKKYLSQSKQNINTAENYPSNRLLTIQKKPIPSKIPDFRRILIMDKSIQKFGFKNPISN